MLIHPTVEKLRNCSWPAWPTAWSISCDPGRGRPSFEDRPGLLVDREETARANRRLKTRLTQARLRLPACMEDIDYRSRRGLGKSLMLSLASCQWIAAHLNVVITGPTGVARRTGCALAQQACRHGLRVMYQRLPRLCHDLEIAKADGSYRKQLAKLARADLLVLDDWGLAPLTPENRRDLLEVLDDRYQARSTLITSQLPVGAWHQYLDDPTLADAILDRVIHNAHKIELAGESCARRRRNVDRTAEGAKNDPCVATPGGGRNAAEQVAVMGWTGRPESIGMGGRNHWNTQPSSASASTSPRSASRAWPRRIPPARRPPPANCATTRACWRAAGNCGRRRAR
ncbi:MAG: ATP-binding protein [bacterium]|nr:ATP-binding protein [bacterium]